MTDSTLAPPVPERSDPVREGDTLARQSHWQAAVSRWLEGHASTTPALRTAADQRLRWLVGEAGPSPGKRDHEGHQRRNAYRMFLLAVLSGVVATVLIILGMQTADGWSPVLAIGGWIGIVASMTFAVAYALRLHTADQPADSTPLTAEVIAQAQTIAACLDHQQAESRQRNDEG